MLWQWKHGRGADDRYRQKAGSFARMDTGLSHDQMDVFYRQLGIRGLGNAAGKNVRFALKWSPVIVTSVEQLRGHAMVVVGQGGGVYEVINPCAMMSLNFDDEGADSGSCAAATLRLSQSQVDKELGQHIWYW
jgi:hypothetical protein